MRFQHGAGSTGVDTDRGAWALESPSPTPGDGPLWSENFCFQAFDPDADAGVFLHLSRTPYDHDLWRELILVALPDGRIAVAKNFGAGACPPVRARPRCRRRARCRSNGWAPPSAPAPTC